MALSEDKIASKSVRNSYISTVVGISLVLFMLGTLGLILLNAQKLSRYVRENIQVQLFLDSEVDQLAVNRTKKMLLTRPYIKQAVFVSKEQAARELQADIGENFVEFLGYNPLKPAINIHLTADYAQPDSIKWIEKELAANPQIVEVYYSPDLIDLVNQNINQISFILLGFTGLLLLVSIALINNTIRLAIFSRRFIIRTMKLVGATHRFIRRPFIVNGIFQGILSALIAFLLIIGVLFILREEIPELFAIQDIFTFIQLFAGIIVLGIVIAWFSTFFAVRKYIRLKTEDIY